MLEGIATAAKVNCEQYNHLCSQAGIQMYPTIRLYLGSRSGMSQVLEQRGHEMPLSKGTLRDWDANITEHRC